MNARILLSAMAVLFLLGPLLPSGAGAGNLALSILGPEKLELSTPGSYNVKIHGPEAVTWGYFVNVSGSNKATASIASPDGKTADGNSLSLVEIAPLAYPEFNFTFTAPSVKGPILLTVTVYALEGAGGAGLSATTEWAIAIKPRRDVTLNTSVANTGIVKVENVKVSFQYRLGGEWLTIANESIPTIEAGKKENVSTVWNSSLLDPGDYRVRIVVDPDAEKVLYSGSRMVIEKTIRLREPGAVEEKPVSPALVALIIIIIAGAVGTGYWYWKKKIV